MRKKSKVVASRTYGGNSEAVVPATEQMTNDKIFSTAENLATDVVFEESDLMQTQLRTFSKMMQYQSKNQLLLEEVPSVEGDSIESINVIKTKKSELA